RWPAPRGGSWPRACRARRAPSSRTTLTAGPSSCRRRPDPWSPSTRPAGSATGPSPGRRPRSATASRSPGSPLTRQRFDIRRNDDTVSSTVIEVREHREDETMGAAENKELVRYLYEEVSKGNAQPLRDHLADDVT